MPQFSTLIIVRDARDTIGRVVAAAQRVSAEVVVIDSGSADGTQAIAEGAGARVVAQAWLGYGPQKNYGATLCRHDWVLSLDADEVPDATMQEALRAFAKTDVAPTQVHGLLRVTDYCGRWVRHGAWRDDVVWRLYHRDHARWDDRPVHESLLTAPGAQRSVLPGELLHYSYPDAESYARKQEPYLQLSVDALVADGKRATWTKRHLAPAWRFVRGYVLQRGFLDGSAGWAIARADYRMVREKYRRLAERNAAANQPSS